MQIPYIIAEAPSNLLVKRVLPSRWQSRIMVTWGTALCCHAAVKNKEGLWTVRFFLGLMEAGLWPGMLLQMCYWYRPDELARRILYVTVLGYFSTVIGGVLAFAFNGVTTGGLSGWQWLFLTEGIVTVVVGIVAFFAMPDCMFPYILSRISASDFMNQSRLERAGSARTRKLSSKPDSLEIPQDLPRLISAFEKFSTCSRIGRSGCSHFAGRSSQLGQQA